MQFPLLGYLSPSQSYILGGDILHNAEHSGEFSGLSFTLVIAQIVTESSVNTGFSFKKFLPVLLMLRTETGT